VKRSTKLSLVLAPLAALSVAVGTLTLAPSGSEGLASLPNIPWASLSPASAERASADKLVEMEVHDVIPIAEMDTHAVVLISLDGQAILPLFVTEEAAVSIAFRLAEQRSPHPLAADLMDQLVSQLGGKVHEVRIDGVKDDIYTSQVIVRQGQKDVRMNARPSDAIAMALTGKARIVCAPAVIAEAGITRDEIDALRRELGPGMGGSGPHPFFPHGDEEGGDGDLFGPDDTPIKL
jgi:uncharacterized protein